MAQNAYIHHYMRYAIIPEDAISISVSRFDGNLELARMQVCARCQRICKLSTLCLVRIDSVRKRALATLPDGDACNNNANTQVSLVNSTNLHIASCNHKRGCDDDGKRRRGGCYV
eukprot:2617554-Pleurochrysis_carterae.AAC.1